MSGDPGCIVRRHRIDSCLTSGNRGALPHQDMRSAPVPVSPPPRHAGEPIAFLWCRLANPEDARQGARGLESGRFAEPLARTSTGALTFCSRRALVSFWSYMARDKWPLCHHGGAWDTNRVKSQIPVGTAGGANYEAWQRHWNAIDHRQSTSRLYRAPNSRLRDRQGRDQGRNTRQTCRRPWPDSYRRDDPAWWVSSGAGGAGPGG
jgi:hypothetical protein